MKEYVIGVGRTFAKTRVCALLLRKIMTKKAFSDNSAMEGDWGSMDFVII